MILTISLTPDDDNGYTMMTTDATYGTDNITEAG